MKTIDAKELGDLFWAALDSAKADHENLTIRTNDGEVFMLVPAENASASDAASGQQGFSEERAFAETERLAKLGHFVWDEINDRCLYCSPELARLHGVSVEGFLSLSTSSEANLTWVHPEDHDDFSESVRKVSEDGQTVEFRYRLMRSDGTHIHVREVDIPSVDDNGVVTRIYGFVEDISERVLSERVLRRSQDALDRAERMGRVGSWHWDTEKEKLLSWSEEYARIHGVPMEGVPALLSHQMEKVIHPEDRGRVEREFKRFDDENLDYEIEYRIVRPDGEIRHVVEVGETVRDRGGVPIEQSGIVQDITERKENEDELRRARDELDQRVQDRTSELRKSEERFRTLCHQSPLGVSLEDYSQIKEMLDDLIIQGFKDLQVYLEDNPEVLRAAIEKIILLDANDTLIKMSGTASFEEYKVYEENFPSWEDEHWAKFHIAEVMALAFGTGTYSDEVLDTNNKGEVSVIRCTVRIVPGHEDDWGEIITTHEDITRRREIERRTGESEARLKALFENASEGMFFRDAEGRYEMVNSTFANRLGFDDASEIIGKTLYDLFPKEDADRFREEDVYCMDFGEISTKELHVPLPNSVEMVQFTIKFPIVSDEGTITGVGGIDIDITERNKLDRMKTEFVSTVSHELRTPLTSIKGSLGLVRGGSLGVMPEVAVPMIDVAYKNTTRLIHLVNDVLDMEKIASGQMEYEFQSLNLSELVTQTVETHHEYTAEYGDRRIVVDSGTEMHVTADSNRLIQVIANLLSNAIKFSPEGGTIEIKVERVDGLIRTSFADAGVGIPDDFREHIFERFTQADSSDSRKIGGTGLGLNISKSIIEKHGGEIDFESEVGVGTTFFFTLPVQQ